MNIQQRLMQTEINSKKSQIDLLDIELNSIDEILNNDKLLLKNLIEKIQMQETEKQELIKMKTDLFNDMQVLENKLNPIVNPIVEIVINNPIAEIVNDDSSISAISFNSDDVIIEDEQEYNNFVENKHYVNEIYKHIHSETGRTDKLTYYDKHLSILPNFEKNNEHYNDTPKEDMNINICYNMNAKQLKNYTLDKIKEPVSSNDIYVGDIIVYDYDKVVKVVKSTPKMFKCRILEIERQRDKVNYHKFMVDNGKGIEWVERDYTSYYNDIDRMRTGDVGNINYAYDEIKIKKDMQHYKVNHSFIHIDEMDYGR